MVWDRLAAHRSKEVGKLLLQVSAGRLDVVFLPGYAPDLNQEE